jgi:putative ABC transport system permease protein
LLNKLVFENVRHRPVRTLLSVLAIAVEVTMILTLVGVSYGTLDESAQRARGIGADIMFRSPTSTAITTGALMSSSYVDFLMKQPHVTFAMGIFGQSLGGFEVATGLDLDQFNKLNGGFRLIQGRPFQADDEIMVDEYYARENKLRVGSTINLLKRDWRVSGIFESGKLTHVALKLKALQDLTGNPDKFSQIYVKLDDPKHAQAVVDELRKQLPDYNIYTIEEFTSLLTISSVGLLKDFIGVVIGIAVIVGFIVVSIAMYTAVLERTREIGILKSLGASSAYILNLLVRETLLIAIIGTIAGILLTYGTRWVIMHAVPASLTQEIVYAWWPIAAAIAIAGALLGVIFPGWKAVKQDAIVALAYE